jgi:hypothetical protein
LAGAGKVSFAKNWIEGVQMATTGEWKKIIRTYESRSDEKKEHVILRLNATTGKVTTPSVVSGFFDDILKIVVVPDKSIWLNHLDVEVKKFETGEAVVLRYRVNIKIAPGKEVSAVEALIGKDKRPDTVLRDTVGTWLNGRFDSSDMSRIKHVIADDKKAIEEALSDAASESLGVELKILFELDGDFRDTALNLPGDVAGLISVSPADAGDLSLPLRVGLDLERIRSHESVPEELPPNDNSEWAVLIRKVVKDEFLRRISAREYFFYPWDIEDTLKAAFSAELGQRGFECRSVYVSDRTDIKYGLENLLIVEPLDGGYRTQDSMFDAKFDIMISWSIENFAIGKKYLFPIAPLSPPDTLLNEIKSVVTEAARSVMFKTTPHDYFCYFYSRPEIIQDMTARDSNLGELLQRKIEEDLLQKVGIKAGNICFARKDKEIVKLPDSPVYLQIEVANARGIPQRIKAVFHVEGISSVNPMKALSGIKADELKVSFHEWSMECLKNLRLADVTKIDTIDFYDPNGGQFILDARVYLEKYVAERAAKFHGIDVTLKSVNRFVTIVDEMFEPSFEMIEEMIREARQLGDRPRITRFLEIKYQMIGRLRQALKDESNEFLEEEGAIRILSADIKRITKAITDQSGGAHDQNDI